MAMAKRELIQFMDELVELASEENKTRAILVKEKFISDFVKAGKYGQLQNGRGHWCVGCTVTICNQYPERYGTDEMRKFLLTTRLKKEQTFTTSTTRISMKKLP